jgi:hypothetical protein
MEQQRQKEQEEAKAKQEKERRSKLKRQSKQVLRDKQKQELEQQRMKSYAKLKKRKEKDAMLKKSKSAILALSPTLTYCSHESLSMMSPASSSTEITVSTITADEELLDHPHDACMPPIGCFHLPVVLTPEDTSNDSFFLSSWMDHVTAVGGKWSDGMDT